MSAYSYRTCDGNTRVDHADKIATAPHTEAYLLAESFTASGVSMNDAVCRMITLNKFSDAYIGAVVSHMAQYPSES